MKRTIAIPKKSIHEWFWLAGATLAAYIASLPLQP
jgi:hypothetical protein